MLQNHCGGLPAGSLSLVLAEGGRLLDEGDHAAIINYSVLNKGKK